MTALTVLYMKLVWATVWVVAVAGCVRSSGFADPSAKPDDAQPPPPRALALNGPSVITAGQCQPYTVQVLDDASPLGVAQSVPIALGVSGLGKFYEDNSCASQIDQAVLASGVREQGFWFRNQQVELVQLTVAGPSTWSTASFEVTTIPAVSNDIIRTLRLTGETAITIGDCQPYSVEVLESDELSAVETPLPLPVSATNGAKTYEDATCLLQIAQVLLPANVAQDTFYVRSSNPGAIALSISGPANWPSGSLALMAAHPPADLSWDATPLTDFGRTLLNEETVQTYTLRNSASGGPATLATEVALGLSDPLSWAGGSCASNMALESGQTCTVDVAFAPTEIGVWEQTLEVSYQDSLGSHQETLDVLAEGVASLDQWQSINLEDTPIISDAAAIWSGTQALIWGGTTSSGNVNTGFLYHPILGMQGALQTVGAPSVRTAASGVWTGTEMLVWGGWDDGSGPLVPYNTGGRYSPQTDTWGAALSTSGAPTARYDHSAVWTGTEMIVWGGSNDSSLYNNGGRYNPATDSWSAGPTATGAPTSRTAHVAVWTGTEMLIWGGDRYGQGATNSGGRYNPTSNSWSTMSTVGAPSARGYASAVWTGTEMIVWGGIVSSGGAMTNTGGRYNPATDTWDSATSLVDAPQARADHNALWTGNRMLILGGYGTAFLGTMYAP